VLWLAGAVHTPGSPGIREAARVAEFPEPAWGSRGRRFGIRPARSVPDPAFVAGPAGVERARDGGWSPRVRRTATGLMALRVAEPLPLRTLGIAAVALGALIVEAAAASRPPAIVSLVLIALGAVLLDGVRDRRLTPTRHVGLFSLIVGASLTSWAAIVLVVMALFDLDSGSHLVVLLSVGALGAATGVVLLRRPVTQDASDRSAGRAGSKAGHRVRTS
jgi:hypothetical protein